MTYDPTPPSPPDRSEPFIEMAARINLNAVADFSGAFVLVPPDGKHKSLLVLDNSQSPAVFWGLLRTTAEIALAELADAERMATSYGRR